MAVARWTRNPKIVNLLDTEVFVHGTPRELFKTLRNEYPVYWNEEPDPEPGFWNLTKYNDVVAASNDSATFSSAKGINIYYEPEVDPAINGALIGNMITMDPPMHTEFRRFAAPFFTLRAVRGLQSRIRELASAILDDAEKKNDCDFMVDVAARLPIAVLCDILGVPDEDHGKIFDWSNKMVGIDDPELNPDRMEAFGTMMEVFAYGQYLTQQRREQPSDDLMSAMANAKFEGVDIPDVLMDGFFLLMVIAGNETTRNTITGGLEALFQHRDQFDLLLQDTSLIPSAVEEILRWVSPVMHMRRTATRDTEIRGVSISEGDKVVMWYGAANHDEEIFENPHVFDVKRSPNEHIAFGIGRHRCLGMTLAQAQLRTIYHELLTRFPNMELTGEVKHLRSNFINGIREMPVRLRP